MPQLEEALRSKDIVCEAVRSIGDKLEKRGAFCRPTLPFLRQQGVVGFCWLSPAESFPGLKMVWSGGEGSSKPQDMSNKGSETRSRLTTVVKNLSGGDLQEDTHWQIKLAEGPRKGQSSWRKQSNLKEWTE